MAHGRTGVIVHRIMYATFTTIEVLGMVHTTVFGPSIVRINVGGDTTNWYAAVPDTAKVTVFVLVVVDVVVMEIVFGAASPTGHESISGMYVTPATGVGVSVITLASVGAALGVTVTT